MPLVRSEGHLRYDEVMGCAVRSLGRRYESAIQRAGWGKVGVSRRLQKAIDMTSEEMICRRGKFSNKSPFFLMCWAFVTEDGKSCETG
jgi:hypothetical protein